ncbi:hypothetical protein LZ32DRAFT_156913 [Colletotrichum eremochloae]|nr:hypothetical protein LZ32DRAFT_156913 [Colletotrichum eremochloae]
MTCLCDVSKRAPASGAGPTHQLTHFDFIYLDRCNVKCKEPEASLGGRRADPPLDDGDCRRCVYVREKAADAVTREMKKQRCCCFSLHKTLIPLKAATTWIGRRNCRFWKFPFYHYFVHDPYLTLHWYIVKPVNLKVAQDGLLHNLLTLSTTSLSLSLPLKQLYIHGLSRLADATPEARAWSHHPSIFFKERAAR